MTLSGLFVRRNRRLNKCTQEVNKILAERCEEEGFTYIDQSAIKVKDLTKSDGLHLGFQGSRKLMSTLVETINPKKTSLKKKEKPQVNHTSLRFHNNNYEHEEISTDEEESEGEEEESGNENGSVLNYKPGVRSYRDVVEEGEKTVVFSNSITKGINADRFNNAYRGTAEFIRFTGKKAQHMKNDIKEHLEKIRPDSVIIQSGGNDLATSAPTADIAEQLIEAAAVCQRFGVSKICIGGVVTRPGLQGRCININNTLRRRCRARNYVFIENNFIFLNHLYDNVHLDEHGSKILADNYLDVLEPPIVRQ